jgi:hypothetical protein
VAPRGAGDELDLPCAVNEAVRDYDGDEHELVQPMVTNVAFGRSVLKPMLRPKPIQILCTALVSLLLIPAASTAAGPKGAIARARNLLRGHVYVRFTQSGVLDNSLDQRLHLCSSGKFIYDTVSNLPETGTTVPTRVTGRWRVLSAHFARHGLVASARVRGVPADGSSPLTVRFTRDRHGTIAVDGHKVDVQRSDQCS